MLAFLRPRINRFALADFVYFSALMLGVTIFQSQLEWEFSTFLRAALPAAIIGSIGVLVFSFPFFNRLRWINEKTCHKFHPNDMLASLISTFCLIAAYFFWLVPRIVPDPISDTSTILFAAGLMSVTLYFMERLMTLILSRVEGGYQPSCKKCGTDKLKAP